MKKKVSKFKKKIRNAAIKAGEFLTDPSVRSTSRFAAGLLEVLSNVDRKNPISLVTGGISLVDGALESFDIPHPTKTEHFAKKHNLQVKNGALPRLLADAGLLEKLATRSIITEGSWDVKELVLDEDSKIYYAENKDNSVYYQDPLGRLAGSYYHTENFNFSKLFDMIWDRYKNGVFISAINKNRTRWEDHIIRLHDLTTEDCLYIGDIDISEFSKDLLQFKQEGISRSFMLAGDPGTGKTSFVIEVARKISNRIIRIDPTVAYTFSSSEFDFLIENLKPDIIIFDDFDRAAMQQDSQHLLFLLENIKYRFPEMILFATVNYFNKLDKALVRPGRFDEIMWFDPPSPEIRKKIAIKYLDINQVSYSLELLENIVNKTEGMSPVYIKELCIRLRHKGPDSLDNIIKEFTRVLSEGGSSYEEFLGPGLVMEFPESSEEHSRMQQVQLDLEEENQ